MNAALILQGGLLAAIFLLFYVACDQLFEMTAQAVMRRMRLRRRLPGPHPLRLQLDRAYRATRYSPRALLHIQDLLESLNIGVSLRSFMMMSAVSSCLGLAMAVYIFADVRSLLLLPLMFATGPYIALRMRLISRQMRARLDFLPAVEVLYQYYVMAETRNIRQVMAACLTGRRLRMPVRRSFELLFRHLSTNRPVEDALRIFSFSLGHIWGQYLTNILRVGLTEGVDLSDSLQELMRDMRQAQKADHAARNRLLEIRIANFSPPFFYALFIIVNLQLNGEQAVHYYLVDPAGRNMLLNGFLLMFASMVMGLWLSIRRV